MFSWSEAFSPAYRAVETPGRFPNASTNNPESSERTGMLCLRKISSDFFWAFPKIVSLSSTTSSRSSSNIISNFESLKISFISLNLFLFLLANKIFIHSFVHQRLY